MQSPAGKSRSHGASIQQYQDLPEGLKAALDAELGPWLLPLTWLIKEFRLHVGYETPDEEAGICFWIDRYERRRGPRPADLTASPGAHWPTATEPALPGTPDEVQQATLWPREAAEKKLVQLFSFRQKRCPSLRILVPLHTAKGAARKWSPKRLRAALHQLREAPGTAIVDPGPDRRRVRSSSSSGARPSQPPRVFSKETQDRLCPASLVVAGGPRLTDEQFAAKVVDLAIDSDGDPQKLKFLHSPWPAGAGTSQSQRRWQEGRSSLKDLNLFGFWMHLEDKASLGLLLPAARAERALLECASGAGFADNVIRLFESRFLQKRDRDRNYSHDAGVLYRFWLSMPEALRSQHHVRGLPEHEAFELLREAVRKMAEDAAQKAQAEAIAALRPRRRWRPPSKPPQATGPTDVSALALLLGTSAGGPADEEKDRPRSASRPKILRKWKDRPRFWAAFDHGLSFNARVRGNMERFRQRHHDGDWPFQKLESKAPFRLEIMKRNKELEQDEKKRKQLYITDDEKQCTFRPRANKNVPPRVKVWRDRIPERNKGFGIKHFVKDLGENFNSMKYPNYHIVHRRRALHKAQRDFIYGSLAAALQKLEGSFAVHQILDRFRCFKRGCGALLDQTSELCRCGGYYCKIHKSPDVHGCAAMKKLLVQRAQQAKERFNELQSMGEKPVPEEKFDNKVELGLILEVQKLAERILEAKAEKERRRTSLERLNRRLTAFGAIRVLQRPFRRRMCARTQEARELQLREAGPRAPTFRQMVIRAPKCDCPDAHHLSELRFPAAESVDRRAKWLQESIAEAQYRADVITGSLAERGKSKKEARAKSAPKKRGAATDGFSAHRARSEPRPAVSVLQLLEDQDHEIDRVFGLLCQTQAHLEDNVIAAAREVLDKAHRAADDSLNFGLEVQGVSARSEGSPVTEATARSLSGHVAVLLGPRPPRMSEVLKLQDRSAGLISQAQDALRRCSELQAEVEQRAALALDAPDGGYSQGPETPQGGVGLVSGVELRSQMCTDLLEAGTCSLGLECPYAHCPEQLTTYAPSGLEEISKVGALLGRHNPRTL